jgi:hypothetical protein
MFTFFTGNEMGVSNASLSSSDAVAAQASERNAGKASLSIGNVVAAESSDMTRKAINDCEKFDILFDDWTESFKRLDCFASYVDIYCLSMSKQIRSAIQHELEMIEEDDNLVKRYEESLEEEMLEEYERECRYKWDVQNNCLVEDHDND